MPVTSPTRVEVAQELLHSRTLLYFLFFQRWESCLIYSFVLEEKVAEKAGNLLVGEFNLEGNVTPPFLCFIRCVHFIRFALYLKGIT